MVSVASGPKSPVDIIKGDELVRIILKELPDVQDDPVKHPELLQSVSKKVPAEFRTPDLPYLVTDKLTGLIESGIVAFDTESGIRRYRLSKTGSQTYENYRQMLKASGRKR